MRARFLVAAVVVLAVPVAALAVGPELVTSPATLPALVGGAVGGALGSWRVNGRTLSRAGRRAARTLVTAHEAVYHRRPGGRP